MPFQLRVGTFDLPPWGWMDPDGTPRGVIYDLHQEVAKRSGFQFTNSIYPFPRLVEMLRNGQLDFISGQPHESLLAAGERLALLHTIDIIIVTRKGSGIGDLEDLKGKTIVYHRVASYPQLDGVPGRIVYVDSYKQSVQLLYHRDEVDAAVFSGPSFYYFIKELGYSTKDFGDILLLESGREDWVFVRKGLPEDVKRALKDAVEAATADKVYETLLEKYCPK